MSAVSLSVLIPAYNEAPRIIKTLETVFGYLSRQPYSWEIIVVNDGSNDDTAARLQSMLSKVPQLFWTNHQRNYGKGAAVRTGLHQARGERILIYDADGATPIEEIEKCFEPLKNGAQIVSGSRRMTGAAVEIDQKRIRRILGAGYRQLCRFFVTPGISDITCGFKLFTQSARDILVPRMRVRGWSFDAEIFVIARQHRLAIAEIPVRWADQRKTKVRLGRDLFASFFELIGILLRKIIGIYR
jgi:dolichyl-phosphate beta-glucosyltransferase